MTATAWANLGDTQDQLAAHFGPKTKPPELFGAEEPLIEGVQDHYFEREGWSIRCALVPATDGKKYVVKEQYRHLASIYVTAPERDALLRFEGAGGLWHRKTIAASGNPAGQPAKGDAMDQLGAALLGAFVRDSVELWERQDGAIASRLFAENANSLVLELPQGRKYEEELERIKGPRPAP